LAAFFFFIKTIFAYCSFFFDFLHPPRKHPIPAFLTDGEHFFPEVTIILGDSSCSPTSAGVAVLVVVVGGDSEAVLALDLVLIMELKSMLYLIERCLPPIEVNYNG
jgi:hypothetical protein